MTGTAWCSSVAPAIDCGADWLGIVSNLNPAGVLVAQAHPDYDTWGLAWRGVSSGPYACGGGTSAAAQGPISRAWGRSPP